LRPVPASLSPAREWAPAALAGLTLAGFVIRLLLFDQSLYADELSSFWVVDGRSLGDVLDVVSSDDEISPPLYFATAWLSLEIGGSAEMIRLPSLLAGTATIPLIYLVGRRTAGQLAGLISAAAVTLSPFLIYYSVEARPYALMIALLTASVLALLKAIESGRARWWAAYAACSCAAMLCHYTAVFPLAAQLGWALWAHREALRALALANLAAAAGFAPWIPGFLADNSSTTTDVLSALQPFDFEAVRFSLGQWAVGFPYMRLEAVPGRFAAALIAAGLVIGTVAGAVRIRRAAAERDGQPGRARWRPAPGIVLIAALLLATPVGEAIVSALGTNMLGARNLNASSPGVALAVGAIVAAAGMPLAIASAALVLGGIGLGTAKTLDEDYARPDYEGVADLVREATEPADVVVDAAALTPAPVTGLGVYLPPGRPTFTLGQRFGNRPFNVFANSPPAEPLIRQALRAARGRSIVLVTYRPSEGIPTVTTNESYRRVRQEFAGELLRNLPPGFEVTERRTFDGFSLLEALVIRNRGAG
jgi:4-amino-4-deoxy-L-arabinose transferase-like glycosyltransferase